MATEIIRNRKADESVMWEEKSGLLDFLSTVNAEVTRFNDTFDFDVGTLAEQPASIDGCTDLLRHLGFVVVRRNSLLAGRDYCLYSVLRGKVLYGYIGVYLKRSIQTVREVGQMTDFRNASTHLHGWLRALIKASCEKI
ncbi:MAG TPA: hypothetical protein VEJ88_05650 [Dissulfurispiraceae bacterium]|nr:hypothetical protein [Dissulfurispiraceae bacterium]